MHNALDGSTFTVFSFPSHPWSTSCHLTNGMEDEHHWVTVVTIACCSFSSEADTVCLPLTALDTRD